MIYDDWNDRSTYKVVVNSDDMYSIWPADRGMVRGWRETGRKGSKKDCLKYIEEVWTDLRPPELRRKMEAAAKRIMSDSSGR